MPLLLPPDLMASVSGFRGRVGHPLTPELVSGLAASFGSFLRETGSGDRVCVGRDSRTSGPMFDRAVVSGLLSVGTRVIQLGVVPTPTLMLSIGHHGAAGGVCITASHNPAEWNALKLATGEGMFLDGETSAAFREHLARHDPVRESWDRLGSVSYDEGAVDRHLQGILGLSPIDLPRIRSRGFQVALDCVHGAGGGLMTALLDALGCEVRVIGGEPDGRFPRDPEPTADNLGDLCALVRDGEADVGMAVDPDGDRLSLVDERGEAVGEDVTLALSAATVLTRRPGVVVTNLSTSRIVEDVAEHYSGTLVRAPVGEINVARRMQLEGAVVGGEGNGGVILPELHLTRDAPVAAALVLQHLEAGGAPLSELVAKWPQYAIEKRKVSLDPDGLEGAYEALAQDLGAEEEDTTDGLRLDWKSRGAWLHVRPSGTEPVVRLIAEARSERETRELLDRAGAILAGEV